MKKLILAALLLLTTTVARSATPGCTAASGPLGLKQITSTASGLQAFACLNYDIALLSGISTGTVNLVAGSVPVGTIVPIATGTVPLGWLECNGASYLRTDYPDLFAQIGTSQGSPVDGLHFNVPDIRGTYISGWNHGRSTDTYHGDFDAVSRSSCTVGGNTGDLPGSCEQDMVGPHTHGYVGGHARPHGGGPNDIYYESDNTIQTSANGGDETRPKNVSEMYIIKADANAGPLGGLTLTNAAIILTSTGGYIISQSSITTSGGFFGDGSHLTNLSTSAIPFVALTNVDNNFSHSESFNSSLSVFGAAGAGVTYGLTVGSETIAGGQITLATAVSTLTDAGTLGISTGTGLAPLFTFSTATGVAFSVPAGSVTASAFFGDGSHLSNIPSAVIPADVAYTDLFGQTFVTSQTITGAGGLLVSGASVTLTGSAGYLSGQSSVTASAFFGDGSHLSGVTAAAVAAANVSAGTFGAGVFLPAGQLTTGPVASGILPSTVAYRSVDNAWGAPQTFGSSATITDVRGLSVAGGSVTASAFFGDGSHITGTTAVDKNWSVPQTFQSSVTVKSNILAVGSSVTASAFFGDASHLTGNIAGQAGTALALAAAGTSASSGYLSRGVDASGNNLPAFVDTTETSSSTNTVTSGRMFTALAAKAATGANGDITSLTALTKISSIVTDTSSMTITNSAGLSVAAGSVTASAFFGDGSHLTGVALNGAVVTTSISSSATSAFPYLSWTSSGAAMMPGLSTGTFYPGGFVFGASTTTAFSTTTVPSGGFVTYSSYVVTANMLPLVGQSLHFLCECVNPVFNTGGDCAQNFGSLVNTTGEYNNIALTSSGSYMFVDTVLKRTGPNNYSITATNRTKTSVSAASAFVANSQSYDSGATQITWLDGAVLLTACIGRTSGAGYQNFVEYTITVGP